MTVNLSETIQKIKSAGPSNVRMVPEPGQNVNTGKYQIEVKEVRGATGWIPIALGLPRATAESIISQATNRVICG